MKVLVTIFFGLIFFSSMAQDGSNIKYYKPNNLDNSLVGKYCCVDFGKDSFAGKVIDTVEINVNGQQMKFYEHRKDDGFNNWFSEQYLIRIDDKENMLTRLQNSRIDSLTSDRIYLTSTLSYYTNNKTLIDTITFFKHYCNKKDISYILIKK